MDNSALSSLRGDNSKPTARVIGSAPEAAQPDIWVDYTLDELRELPFHIQLGADFSAHE